MNIILTGGHSGIGLELTKILLEEGHRIGLIVRSEQRKEDTLQELGADAKVDFFFADLSKREDLVQVATDISSSWDHIDGLFNNAGVLMEKAYYAESGNEMHFEVNAVAPYLLTEQLKPLLDKSEAPFVVNTATGGMDKIKEISIAELKKPTKFVKLLGSYRSSKIAMISMMNAMAKEWPKVNMIHVDPGPNKTKMTKGPGVPGWIIPFRNLLFTKPTVGAKHLHNGAFQAKAQAGQGIYLRSGKEKEIQVELTQEELTEMLN